MRLCVVFDAALAARCCQSALQNQVAADGPRRRRIARRPIRRWELGSVHVYFVVANVGAETKLTFQDLSDGDTLEFLE